jgi:hypothetical protein
MGTWEHMKVGSSPSKKVLIRVLLLGEIAQNTHRNEKGVVYIWGLLWLFF